MEFILGTNQFNPNYNKSKLDINVIEKIFLLSHINNISKIDTSNSYGEGFVESLIGKVLKKNKLKSEILIDTKFGQLNDGYNPKKIQKNFYDSLKRLNIDFINTYYFHSGTNKDFFNDDLWSEINKLKEKGLIRNIGLSFSTKLLKTRNYKQLMSLNKYNINTLQIYCNLFDQSFLSIKQKLKSTSIVYRGIMAKGLLSGKYQINEKFNHSEISKTDILMMKRFIKKNKKISFLNTLNFYNNYLKAKNIIIGVRNVDQLLNYILYKEFIN